MRRGCISASLRGRVWMRGSSQCENAASPQSLIVVDGGGERTVLCRRDERLLLQPEELDRAWIVNARALHVDGFETAAATLAARWARAAGIPVVADLDETYAGVEDLDRPTSITSIVSRDFPATPDGRAQPGAGAAADEEPVWLRGDGGDAWAGRRAGVGWQPFPSAPSLLRHVADTTGAGDVFHAGFIYGLLQGWPLAAPTRFCLRGRGAELHGVRRARRDRAD